MFIGDYARFGAGVWRRNSSDQWYRADNLRTATDFASAGPYNGYTYGNAIVKSDQYVFQQRWNPDRDALVINVFQQRERRPVPARRDSCRQGRQRHRIGVGERPRRAGEQRDRASLLRAAGKLRAAGVVPGYVRHRQRSWVDLAAGQPVLGGPERQLTRVPPGEHGRRGRRGARRVRLDQPVDPGGSETDGGQRQRSLGGARHAPHRRVQLLLRLAAQLRNHPVEAHAGRGVRDDRQRERAVGAQPHLPAAARVGRHAASRLRRWHSRARSLGRRVVAWARRAALVSRGGGLRQRDRSPFLTQTIYSASKGRCTSPPQFQPEPWTYSGAGQWIWQSEGANGDLHFKQTSTAGIARAAVGPEQIVNTDQIVQTRVRPRTFNAAGDPWVGVMARYGDANNYVYMSLRRWQHA